MRAMVVPRWGEVSALREVAEPEAGPGDAVMKVRSAGVGLTLLNMRSGRFGGSTPRIMGHELSGDIVAVGDGVTNVKTGDRCAVYFYLTCGHCRRCRGGQVHAAAINFPFAKAGGEIVWNAERSLHASRSPLLPSANLQVV